MKIFETHAHYDDEAFREDREALFDEMFANDIDTIINVGASFAGCEQSVALADSHEKIYAAVGIHPEDVEELNRANTEIASSVQTISQVSEEVAAHAAQTLSAEEQNMQHLNVINDSMQKLQEVSRL